MSITKENMRRLYNLLAIKDKGYYSLGIKGVAKKLSIKESLLRSLGDRTSKDAIKFHDIFSDYINVFTYNKVTYIGLESRNIDYFVDDLLGINPIVKAIERGEYD